MPFERQHGIKPLFRLLLVGFLIIAAGCAGNRSQVRQDHPEKLKQPEKKKGHERYEQVQFDVYSLDGDDWTAPWNPVYPRIAFNEPLSGKQSPTGKRRLKPAAGDDSKKKTESRMTRGFRIQLVNVTSEPEAKEVRERALALFDSVYIQYRSPNYKVRAGDFLVRANADAAADTARVHGFPEAWVVPAKVYASSSVLRRKQ